MKPRIRLIAVEGFKSNWYECVGQLPNVSYTTYGCGRSPREAYEDWLLDVPF